MMLMFIYRRFDKDTSMQIFYLSLRQHPTNDENLKVTPNTYIKYSMCRDDHFRNAMFGCFVIPTVMF